jgi:hypothetical protein
LVRTSGSPFEKTPTEYESYLNIVTQAHGHLILQLSEKVDALTLMLKEHTDAHAVANRAILMPETKATEKPS